MVSIPIGITDYKRGVAKEANLLLKNRYFEKNPVLNPEEAALIARPGRRKYLDVGDGPIRALFEAPGAFGDLLFVVSGLNLYTVDPATDTVSDLGQISSTVTPSPVLAATAPIGEEVPAYLYIATGESLYCYTERGPGRGHLNATNVFDNDTVTIGDIVYKFTSGSVDTGTPDGTALNPWLIALGVSTVVSIDNLSKAISGTGVAGSTYSTDLSAHTDVSVTAWTGGHLYLRATSSSFAALATTETGSGMAWDDATLTGFGTPLLFQVPVPDELGAVSVVHLNSYIVVVPTQDEEGLAVGRFYWIEPGDTVIDPLNYATAERSPDPILQAIVFSDKLWLCSTQTTEVWITSGDPAAPFQRLQGVMFDRGSYGGTAIQVKDSLILVDTDGAVFQIEGGLKRISRPDIEERIRKAIAEASAI